ncbi:MAG: hypothetical protein LKF82_03845 [Acinetobacter populi]|jgi:hypothetical protein|uniref:hypothetical protein n=1 Tax=Acinetobacter populi TaxID=1582270 RepID=UPI0023527555|nr:hypothetical protein [Acinetobacter populi]MCH4246959.1 hypothetical protein [Acinetobacter populi]
MSWMPLLEEELYDLINQAYIRMSLTQLKLWEIIKIMPVKWQQHPWGDEGNGFWVLAIIGNHVLWYNDIEEGFNLSTFKEWGIIEEYWCNQDDLEWVVQDIINQIRDGYSSKLVVSPPKSL